MRVGAFCDQIRSRFHSDNPFDGFDYKSYPHDMQGGVLTDFMREAFDAVRPQLVIEVGSWKGTSACWWASLMRERGIDGAVICIDTWLGGIEHLRERPITPDWDIRKFRRHGYPTLYYQFLANVMHEGLHDYIVPLPNTSLIAARWCLEQNIHPGLIYVDGSHDEDDVYNDLSALWKLLPTGGIMCGDDFAMPWHGVICGVNRFARERNLRLRVRKTTWALQNFLSAESQFVLNTVQQQLDAMRASPATNKNA